MGEMHSSPTLIRMGLRRIKPLLSALGDPHLGFAVIQIAGTNGKGTTGAYLDHLLRHALASSPISLGGTSSESAPASLPVGRFNSPHLIEPRDSVVVNGAPIDRSVWHTAGQRVEEAVRNHVHDASPFEQLFARAMLSFKLLPTWTRPEILVVEAGLGFQEDATNVFPPSSVLAGVLTQVAWDHEAILGPTLEQITLTKADVFPSLGLGVVADQRREGDLRAAHAYGAPASDDRLSQSVTSLPSGPVAGVGAAEHEILDSVRRCALEKQVRLARAFCPTSAATPTNVTFAPALPDSASGWEQPLSRVAVRYSPTLHTSRGLTGPGYSTRRGEPVIPGPLVEVPATAAHIAGVTTALQTLWSLARDEPLSASTGGLGTDAHEDVRMRIAMFLGMPGAEERVAAAVRQMVWPGRSDWLSVSLGRAASPNQAESDEGDEAEAQRPKTSPDSTPPQLATLVDGAHNPASATALRSYVSLCLSRRTRPARITWIMGFTAGKDVSGMLATLFGPETPSSNEGLADSLGRVHLQDQEDVVHQVALVPFGTPEGMDWIRCMPPAEAQETLRRTLGVSVESRTFGALPEALQWAGDEQMELNATGDAVGVVDSGKLAVVCGSLYLVSDLYRWLGGAEGEHSGPPAA